jgi:hypothetical protein
LRFVRCGRELVLAAVLVLIGVVIYLFLVK